MKLKNLFLTVVLGLVLCGVSYAEDKSGKRKIHEPSEIVKILESSSITYTMDVLKEPIPLSQSGPILSNELFVKTTEGGINKLEKPPLSKEATEKVTLAEKAFENKQYEQALELYRSVQKLEPSYPYVFTLMGDVFFRQGNYKQAKEDFEKAIQENFIDYQAHWFLADTLWALGEEEQAATEITIAHLLNVNHAGILSRLKQYRNETGRPWHEWNFNPQYVISADGEKVTIKSQKEWLGYAMVKAVWKYEPDYAEKMVGSEYKNQAVSFQGEKEAIASLIAGQPNAYKNIEGIIHDGFINEMIFYEIVSKQSPASIVLLPKDDFIKIVSYVNRYH